MYTGNLVTYSWGLAFHEATVHPQKLLNRILWLAVAGVLLRALVPAGYMPAPLADGLPFVPCPGGAPYVAALHQGDHQGQHNSGHAGHPSGSGHYGDVSPAWKFCPFGAVFGNAGLVADEAALSPSPELSPTFAEPEVIVRPALARSWRARAPPV